MKFLLLLIVGCFGVVRSCHNVEWIFPSSVKWTLDGRARVSVVSKRLQQCFMACQTPEGCAGSLENILCKKLKSLAVRDEVERVSKGEVISLKKEVVMPRKERVASDDISGLTVSKQVLVDGGSTLTPITIHTDARNSLPVKQETGKTVSNMKENSGTSIFDKLRGRPDTKRKVFTLTQGNSLLVFKSRKANFVPTGFQLKTGKIQRMAFDIRRSIIFYIRIINSYDHMFQYSMMAQHQELGLKGQLIRFQVVADYQFLVIMSVRHSEGKLITYNYNTKKVVTLFKPRTFSAGNIIVNSKERIVYFAFHFKRRYRLQKVKFTTAGERESVGYEKLSFAIFYPHFDIFGGTFYGFGKRGLIMISMVSKVAHVIKLRRSPILCHAVMATEKAILVFCYSDSCPLDNPMCVIFVYTIDGKYAKRMKLPMGQKGPVFRI